MMTECSIPFFCVIVILTSDPVKNLFLEYYGHVAYQIKGNEMYEKLQSKLFIASLDITEYSISNIKLLGTDPFPLKFPLYNRIFT